MNWSWYELIVLDPVQMVTVILLIAGRRRVRVTDGRQDLGQLTPESITIYLLYNIIA